MTKEASMYEPRIGDLVSVDGAVCVVIAQVTGGIGVRWGNGHEARLGWGFAPLRPDAPGQRVRADGWIGYQSGVTVEPSTSPGGRAGFVVRWDDPANFLYKTSPWSTTFLIRIADQAPVAPVEAPCPETYRQAATYGDLVARTVPPQAEVAAPEYTPTGPTCQHCGSGIVAGFLADTCPRGCDLTMRAAEPEPEVVGTLPWAYANMDAGAPMPSLASSCEPVWTAAGRGVAAAHPTREGAIAAWREAVRR